MQEVMLILMKNCPISPAGGGKHWNGCTWLFYWNVVYP